MANIPMQTIKFPGLEGIYTIPTTAEQVGARPDTWMPTAEEVGARPNDWMPTASDVGAAPAGYGLGTIAKVVSNPNDITATGFYSVVNADVMPTARWWSGYHIKFRDEGYDYQYFYDLNKGHVVSRYNSGAAGWSEWAWHNPPMTLGTEYRTTKRHNGKAVYAKLLDAGALPSSSYKDVSIGATITSLVDLKVSIVTGTPPNDQTFKQLSVHEDDVYANIRWNGTVRIFALTKDMSAYTGTIYIEYTKD